MARAQPGLWRCCKWLVEMTEVVRRKKSVKVRHQCCILDKVMVLCSILMK